MLPQDAVAANLFEIREGQVPSISLTLGASNSKKRSVLSSVSKTAAEAATARSASKTSVVSSDSRGRYPRTRHGYTPIDLRSTADSLEQRDNIPRRNDLEPRGPQWSRSTTRSRWRQADRDKERDGGIGAIAVLAPQTNTIVVCDLRM